MEIPVKSSLSEVYAHPETQQKRYDNILEGFSSRYGQKPDLVLRSPGRVNIIGDHIDYCLFSVLPMAVTADMIMAIKFTDDETFQVANVSPQFEPQTFSLPKDGSQVPIDASKSDWVNYYKCGLVVGMRFLAQKGVPNRRGVKVLIDGNVPTGSGLSSSAAFVVCSTLATLLANGFKDVSKKLLTELSIQCEQLVGVNSGGMDQSASIFGLIAHALYVSFLPELNVKPFAFPSTDPKLAFVVANSLITSNKHETGPVNYNLRVVEVTLGALLMAKKLGLKIRPDGNLQAGTFRGVLDAYFDKAAKPYGDDIDDARAKLEKMDQLVDETITNKDGYTTEEIAAELGVSADEVKQRYMTTYPVRFDKLKLYPRAKHVFQEAKRVLDFLALLQAAPSSTEELFSGLGMLMNQSQDSAETQFNNSCPELDDICRIARAAGAAGSRTTGAGWGGSSVHLVPANKTDDVIKALTEKYYKKRFPNITDAEISDALLVSEPGAGTVVFENLSL
uniref:Galactokinase n=1 Tax=Blastobotrys adeninivorans TaxID=409370 RepID=A0A060SW75_BLAAD